MADEEKKYPSPQELRLRQQEIERAADEKKAREQAEAWQAVQDKKQADIRAGLDKVVATWREGVGKGFELPHVRFVVIAKVNEEGRQAATEFVRTVRQAGFICEVVSGVAYRGARNGGFDASLGRQDGWCIPNVPTIGSGVGATEQALIVRLTPA